MEARSYEVIPSAGRWQLCLVEADNIRTRLWPRYSTQGEAEAEMRARQRRDVACYGAVHQRKTP
jgi:hypothetical protein